MQASDKVEFVQYLEKNGVIDVLTKGLPLRFPRLSPRPDSQTTQNNAKALVSLFEGSTRPEDPLR